MDERCEKLVPSWILMVWLVSNHGLVLFTQVTGGIKMTYVPLRRCDFNSGDVKSLLYLKRKRKKSTVYTGNWGRALLFGNEPFFLTKKRVY